MADAPQVPRVWDRKWAGLVAVAVALALYAPTLVFGQVDFDDPWLWSETSPLRELNAGVLHDVFFELDAHARHPLGSEYLPVRDVVVAIDMAIWGDNEHGPHATQLALFALTVFGLGTLFVALGVPRPIAWLGTLLWAAHPIHVESVAWLSERKGVLAGLFVIACGHAWVRYRRDRAWWWVVVAAVASIAAVWSKAPAMFGPAAFAAWDLLVLPRARRRWIAIGAIGLATALAAVPVIVVASDARVIDEAEGADRGRIVSALGVQGHYLESLALVKAPSIAYPIQTDGPAPIDLAIGGAAVCGSIALLVYLRRDHAQRWRLAVLAWAWIWFVPISQLVAPVHILVADRFAYLWSIAGCVFVAALVDRLRPTVRLAVTGALVCVLGIATLRAENAWTNSVELFTRGFEANPRDAQACENLARALHAIGHPAEALAALDRGLVERPNHSHLMVEKARILDQIGHHAEALAVAKAAAETDAAGAMWSYAEMLEAAGRPAEALPWAERASRRHPELVIYRRTEAELLLALHRDADAERVLRAVLALDPRAPVNHLQLATALVRLGRVAEALPELALAARDPALAAAVEEVRRSIDPGSR